MNISYNLWNIKVLLWKFTQILRSNLYKEILQNGQFSGEDEGNREIEEK